MFLEILLIFTIFLIVVMSIFVLSQKSKSVSNILFSFLGFIASIWTFTNYMMGINSSVFWLNSSYAFGSLVIATGLIWILELTDKKLNYKQVWLIYTLSIIFFILSYVPGFMVKSYDQTYMGLVASNNAGWGTSIYIIYYITISYLMLLKLFKRNKISTDTVEKAQLQLIIWGVFISLFASFISTILPLIFHLSIWGIDAVGFLIFLTFIAYSITRHHLFNIRVIAIELVTFGLWTTILIRTLMAKTMEERLIEASLLVITVIFGITLIRSTFHIIKQRERIEKLAENLQKAYGSLRDLNENLEKKVAEQTLEISRAYEVEKTARRDLEKLDETKNELITAAQHNLRTPLTALRWQLEVIRNDLSKKNKATSHKEFEGALKESEVSIESLTKVLEDFLNISALKVGGYSKLHDD